MFRFARSPAALLVASTIMASALGVVSGALQARILGPAARGELAMAATPGTLVAMLLCIGIPDYVTRAAARGSDPRRLSALSAVVAVTVGVLAFVPYFVLAGALLEPGSDSWVLLVTYAATVPLWVYGYCLTAIAVGLGKWPAVAALRVVPIAVSVLALFALWTMNTPTQGPLTVGWILIASSALLPLGLLSDRDLRPLKMPSWREARTALAFGGRSWVSGSISLLNQRIDLLLVTVLSPALDVGYYAVSVSLAAIISAAVNAVVTPVKNKFAVSGARGLDAAASLVFVATLIGVAVLLPLLPILITVVLGSQFLPAAPIMSLVMIAQVPLASIITLTQAAISLGRPATPIIGEAAALICAILITVLAYPSLGYFAAAIGALVSRCVSLTWLVTVFRIHYKLPPHRIFLPRIRDIRRLFNKES